MIKRILDKSDFLSVEDYLKIRSEKRAEIIALKKNRRVTVGPYATLYFENVDTMWYQIQEMLLIERGGDEQLEDELVAYTPLLPHGSDLRLTVMFEVEDVTRRERLLRQWTGIEETLTLSFAGQKIPAIILEDGQDRTTEDGKTSSVHFVKFDLSPEQVKLFKQEGVDVMIGFKHPNYTHVAVLPESVKEALCKDFD